MEGRRGEGDVEVVFLFVCFFISHARTVGEGSTNHSLPALLFCF